MNAPAVVLTGPNGAGKTNLLEALSFLAPGRGLRMPASGSTVWRQQHAGGLGGVGELTTATARCISAPAGTNGGW